MTIESALNPDGLLVADALSVQPRQERGVVISERQYQRLIERLDRCKPRGWADLWLAGAGAGASLVVTALVAVLTLTDSFPSDIRDVLWVLAGAGTVVVVLCVLAYVTQRHNHGEQIDELKRDFVMYMGPSG